MVRVRVRVRVSYVGVRLGWIRLGLGLDNVIRLRLSKVRLG
jgi:hypothetical protein